MGGMGLVYPLFRGLLVAVFLASTACTGVSLDPSALLGAGLAGGLDDEGSVDDEDEDTADDEDAADDADTTPAIFFDEEFFADETSDDTEIFADSGAGGESDAESEITGDATTDAEIQSDAEVDPGSDAAIPVDGQEDLETGDGSATEVPSTTESEVEATESTGDATERSGGNAAQQEEGGADSEAFPTTDPDTGAVVMGPGIAKEDCEDYLAQQQTSLTTVAYMTMPEGSGDTGLVMGDVMLGAGVQLTAEGTSDRDDADGGITARLSRTHRARIRSHLKALGTPAVVVLAQVAVVRDEDEDEDDDGEYTCPIGKERGLALQNYLSNHELVVTDLKTGGQIVAPLSSRGKSSAIVLSSLSNLGVTLSVRHRDAGEDDNDDDEATSQNLVRLFKTGRLINVEERFF